jgi:hypothetical protein
MLSGITKKLLIIQTHFSVDEGGGSDEPHLETHGVQRFLVRAIRTVVRGRRNGRSSAVRKFNLSPITENESLRGRWYPEFASELNFDERERLKWASWDNHRSFWIQREYLLQTIQDVGFDAVLEQFDGLERGQSIVQAMIHGYYKTDTRGTFIGIKTPLAERNAALV